MMNSTNKLSVIIPLYNAGDDFRTCMESLITQTWTALEIIIINAVSYTHLTLPTIA